MESLFIYGTLGHPPLLRAVLGTAVQGVTMKPATLPGWRVSAVAGEVYPMIAPEEGAKARGLLLTGLSGEALARADFYEAISDYRRRPVEVQLRDGSVVDTSVYVSEGDDAPVPLGAWSATDWEAQWADISVLAAEEVMDWMGRVSPAEVGRRYQVICTRAQARINARDTAPTSLRRKARPEDLQVKALRRPYANFFAVEEYRLSHTRFDGTASGALERAAFISADAVTVLPYDRRRDRVMLIEQFRIGAHARGDAQPWVLEPIAGRIDPGESPEDCAHREALEEAGLHLERLIRYGGFYASPGAKTEFLHGYIGLAELPDDAEGLGGVPGEGEDIRAHVMGFEDAMALMQSGEINVAPTALALLNLAAMREALLAG